MKILVTGCNGLLGQNLIEQAPENTDVYGIDLQDNSFLLSDEKYQRLNFLDRKKLLDFVEFIHPDWIINAAAYTNVDGAEVERELCWQVNVEAIENLVYAARKTGTRILHVSTDYIFNGKNGPYAEDASPDPVGFYGRSKLAGENVLKISPVDYAIVRTMVLYGHVIGGRPNFVTWLVENLKNGNNVRIVNDQFGNTTLAEELADGCWTIVEQDARGVFHIAGSEIVDRFTFAEKIAAVFDLNPELIQPITTADLQQAAPRPMQSGLIVDKAVKELGLNPSNVEEGLIKFKERYNNK